MSKIMVEEFCGYGKHPGVDRIIHRMFKTQEGVDKAWAFFGKLRRKSKWLERKTRGPLLWKDERVTIIKE